MPRALPRPEQDEETPFRRCYWVYIEDGTAAHIPMCIGSAVNGPEACTCATPRSELDALQAEVDRLRYRLGSSVELCQRYRDERNTSEAMARHWRKVLRDHGIEAWRHNPPESPKC